MRQRERRVNESKEQREHLFCRDESPKLINGQIRSATRWRKIIKDSLLPFFSSVRHDTWTKVAQMFLFSWPKSKKIVLHEKKAFATMALQISPNLISPMPNEPYFAAVFRFSPN